MIEDKALKHREYQRRYCLAHPDRVRESKAKWKKANPDKVREYKQINKEKTIEQKKIAQKRWNIKNKDKMRVYKIVHTAISNGSIVRDNSCSSCGAINVRIEGHHYDYSNPHDLTWLCYACHRLLHKKRWEGV